jgi:hypothetical protein
MSGRTNWKRCIGTGVAALLVGAAVATAQEPAAVKKVTGNSAPNALANGLVEGPVVQGSQPLENATGVFGFYGYNANGPMLPAPGDIQAPGHNVEASKTEPDKNTYLVLDHQKGPDPDYDYGRHFLFQGHETGLQGYITRVNLDADDAHRVTLWTRTGTRCRCSTARPGIRSRSACSSRKRTRPTAVCGHRLSTSRRSSTT